VTVLNRKLGRELQDAWLRLLAIMGIIAVGVACFVTLGSSYRNLTEAKQRYYRQCRMADFWIDLKKAPLAELDAVGQLPGMAAMRPRIQFYATVDLKDVVRPLNGMVLSLPDRREPVINDIVLRRGSYFTDRRENEVILNDAFARQHGLEPGMWIRLVLNNRRQELFVVGTAISSEFVYLVAPGSIVPDPEHYGIFYLKNSYAEDVFDFDGAANQVVGRFAPGSVQPPREVLRRAEQVLAPYGVFTTTLLENQGSNKYLTQEIQGLGSFGVVLPIIFLAVAALVLNVLLSRLAEQERTVVGTLKALGYSDRQLFLHFLKFGLTVGLLGGLVGCGLGYLLAGLMTMAYRWFFEFPELHNRFHLSLHAIGLGISLACAVVGSLRGTRAVLRLEPAQAMRPKPPKQGGAVWLERLPWLWQRLTTGWRIVLRDVVRNRVRTAAGVFAAMMGAGVMVCGFMLSEATFYLVDFQFKWLLKSDIDLAFKDEKNEDALLEAARLPGVDRAEPTLHVGCDFYNGAHTHKGGVIGLAPDARLTVPRDRQARPVRVPSAGLAMTRTLADMLHVQRGDWITIQPIKGLRRRLDVQVVEIADSYLGTTVYADIRWLSRLIGEELALTGVQLAVDKDPRHLDALYRELKQLPALEAVNSRADMIQSLEETIIQNMWVSIGMFILFAGVVFFGSILNASLVSLAERQREVATLRVLGYGPWMIGSLLLRESMIVTLLGTALGMPFGYLLSVLIAYTYESEMFRFPVVSSPGTWFWTLVLAVVYSLAAHGFVQRAVHRMDWLEALKAKE